LDAAHALPAIHHEIGADIEVPRARREKDGRPSDILFLPDPLGRNDLFHRVCVIPRRLIQIGREVTGRNRIDLNPFPG